jgi:hypothetical protein
MLPVELSNINDLPINTERGERVVWLGDDPKRPPGVNDPGFQIYFLDTNAYRDADKTFWVKGESRADFLLKTVPVLEPDGSIRPARRLTLTLTAGPLAVRVNAGIGNSDQQVVVPAEDTRQITFELGRPFTYMDKDDNKPRFVWSGTISADRGFVPALNGGSTDTRFLGIRVRPLLVE